MFKPVSEYLEGFCPPPAENGVARTVTAPAAPGQGVGTRVIKKGSKVLKGDVLYVVASVSRSGVVKLDHLSGGFAKFSHTSVCVLA